MKIILLKDIAGVGRRGDMKNVADGYALNFLLPGKFAAEATQQAIQEIEKMRAQRDRTYAQTNKDFESVKSQLQDKAITIKKRADEKGSLYAAISSKDVVSALRNLKNSAFEKIKDSMIEFDGPIKTTGEHHSVSIKMGTQSLPIKLEIVAEKKK